MSRRDEGRGDLHESDRERLDALISAAMDGSIEDADRIWLEERLAADDEAVARARAFDRVDAELRTLAEAPSLSEERLAAGFERLRSRLQGPSVESGGVAAENPEFDGPHRGRPGVWRRRWVPALIAAAAALALYLILPGVERGSESGGGDSRVGIPADEGIDDTIEFAENIELDEELSLVLGYGEDPFDLDEATIDDLEIIEQLDLLDFLSAREAREREGRG